MNKDNLIIECNKWLGVQTGDERHKELVKYYNEHCIKHVKRSRRYHMNLTDNWCAMFLSVCALKAGLKGFPIEVSVHEMKELMKEYHQIVKNPSEGDIIFYDWNGDNWLDHVGLVVSVVNDVVYTVEGNAKGGRVANRSINKLNKVIDSYGRLVLA